MTKQINLALQGGGSHGAFTWGVLDALLEDERIGIEAISGTSAGAMNAVVVADGLMRGGRHQARASLTQFWQAISDAAISSPIQRSPLAVLMGNWSLDTSPGYLAFEALSRTFSPYQANPLNLNPLRDVLVSVVDFERVRHCDAVKLFISATNVHTGRVKVFDGHELTADMVMASACLPQLFQAVQIGGVPYWDGGYMGNPALFPFFKGCASADIMIVQINPVERTETPDTSQEIQNRMNEITFNASLLKELRAIDFITRLIDKGHLTAKEYRKMHLHMVRNEEVLNPLGATSKLNAEWAFLQMLHDAGRQSAQQWLEQHYDALGNHSSVDLRAMFQGQQDRSARH
ncbi:MAG: patatin-like phospholipase family protein [Burkholderiaceae bacterium]